MCAGWLQEEQPGKQPSDQEQRRMTAEQVAEAIRNGDMVHDRVYNSTVLFNISIYAYMYL